MEHGHFEIHDGDASLYYRRDSSGPVTVYCARVALRDGRDGAPGQERVLRTGRLECRLRAYMRVTRGFWLWDVIDEFRIDGRTPAELFGDAAAVYDVFEE